VVDAIRHLVDVGVNGGLVAIEVEREAEALVAAICADDADAARRWAGLPAVHPSSSSTTG